MAVKKKIDLNSDVGESFGIYQLGLDEQVIPLISSANIACGFHAGDPAVMRRTLSIAKENGVAAGAHPGFPDLIGFGRRNLDVSIDDIKDYVIYQVGALKAFATVLGVTLQHVKPHGALYNMAQKNLNMIDAFAQAVSDLDKDLILVVLAGPNRKDMQSIADRHGIRMAFEFFADRAYEPDGSLVSRQKPGAVIHDPQVVSEKILKMVHEGKVTAIDGSDIALSADTICVHGDNPAAVRVTSRIREDLLAAGIEIAPTGTFL